MAIKKAKVNKIKETRVTMKFYKYECPFCGEGYEDETYKKLDYFVNCRKCEKDFDVSSE